MAKEIMTLASFFKTELKTWEPNLRQSIDAHNMGYSLEYYKTSLDIAIRSNPAILKCDPISIIYCVKKAIEDSASLDPRDNEAWIIPYGTEAQYQRGYDLYRKLAIRGGDIKRIYARAVYKNDVFEWDEGLNPVLIHKPEILKERGCIVAGYAIAEYANGEKHFNVIDLPTIERAKSCAQTKSVWAKHEEEMVKKTAIKRLGKDLPLMTENISHRMFKRAINSDDAQDAGVIIDYDALMNEDVREPQTKEERLIDSLDKKISKPATQQAKKLTKSEMLAEIKHIAFQACGEDVESINDFVVEEGLKSLKNMPEGWETVLLESEIEILYNHFNIKVKPRIQQGA